MKAALGKFGFACTAILALVSARATAAISTAPEYRACVAKTATKPDDAFEDALVWRDMGGGAPAEHCAALALLAMNQPGQAALRLDRIARDPKAGTLAVRADLLDQSGNAWLLARQAANAEAAFSAALKLAPRSGAIWADRARARAMNRNWKAAESDLPVAWGYSRTAEI